MARKKGGAHSGATAASSRPRPTAVSSFPSIARKPEVRHHTLLEGQILLMADILSAAECKAFVKFIDELPLELTPPKKRGEAERVNYRFSIQSADFAERLRAVLVPHLPSFPSPVSTKEILRADDPPRLPQFLNSNIRVYKYMPSQHFGKHYDDSVRDPVTGAISEWTLLIYLTGAEDGVEGGNTLFYKEQRGRTAEVITAPLSRGTALLHRHGQECMLHEGSPVTKGIKYVLRSDLMFLR